MIVLWLLVAHLVGDYLLQTRWQAVGKFGWSDEAYWLRARHVLAYTVPFVPVALVYGDAGYHGNGAGIFSHIGAGPFLVLLATLHFLTDAQRFASTPGEWLVWQFGERPNPAARPPVPWTPSEMRAAMAAPIREPLPPNPWPTIGLAIDQTLHLIQIAVLAEVFLR